jgi:hypothetical protein
MSRRRQFDRFWRSQSDSFSESCQVSETELGTKSASGFEEVWSWSDSEDEIGSQSGETGHEQT